MCRDFASRLRAVMAADAVAEDIHVGEIRRDPCASGVAVVAGIVACYVGRMLAGGTNTVVAANAVAGYAAVIEDRR